MISNSNFIEIIHHLFLHPIHLISHGFRPSFSTNIKDFIDFTFPKNIDVVEWQTDPCCGKAIWWHEEPLDSISLEEFQWRNLDVNNMAFPNPYLEDAVCTVGSTGICQWFFDVTFQIFINSEKSQLKKDWLKKYPYYDWYFFYHGFAALDWYRDYKYMTYSDYKISKVFICLNHLINKKRSYRISLLSQLKANDLYQHGYISAPLLTQKLVKEELYDKNSYISSSSKKHIFTNLLPTATPMILDDVVDYNNASASITNGKFSHSALWHVVTETIYYEEKLHLTEKIFKPIVLKRPFILVGSVGNLAYFKNYGFKTFDRWIDESYDDEPDPDIRMLMITNEIKKLCSLPHHELLQMYEEMKPTLEYNHAHFFGKFKEIIVDEMIDNFKKCVFLYNMDQSERFRIPDQNLNYTDIRNILLS